MDMDHALVGLHEQVDALAHAFQRRHDLRHGAASLMLASGEDLKTVSEQLGHADVRLTLKVYVTPGSERRP
jgi:integrase